MLLRALSFNKFAVLHPDEVLQYLEPAYRLLTGQGIVTWEFRYGMRGWLVTWLLAGPMVLGQALGGSAMAGIIAARFAAAAIGLIPVVSAWHLGRRLSPEHGIVAMAVASIWYEQIVFSTHVLTESLAASFFIGAAALISKNAGRAAMMAGGAMLACAVIIRFHYGVAAFAFVLFALTNDWKRWSWLIFGSLPALILSGTTDLVMGEWPFEWVFNNIHYNLIEGRADDFGVEPASYYLSTIWIFWGWLTPMIVISAIASGKPFRPLLYAAICNLIVHCLIPHKEYRFIELTCLSLIILAAIGSVNLLQWLYRKRPRATPQILWLVALISVWAAASVWLGRDRPLNRWFANGSFGPELDYLAGRDPRVCGLGVLEVDFAQTSRAYLGRPMPIVALRHTERPQNLLPPGEALQSVNAVIAPPNSSRLLPGYGVVKCKLGDVPRCLFIRDGACRPTRAANERELQRVMILTDR